MEDHLVKKIRICKFNARFIDQSSEFVQPIEPTMEGRLDDEEEKHDKEYLKHKENIRLRRIEFMDSKLLMQKFSDQVASDGAMLTDVRDVKARGFTTPFYHG